MPYGTIKVDNIVFTNSGVDQTVTVSGLVQSVSGNLTVTGTISGSLIRGTTVSGATITGSVLSVTSGLFASGTVGAPTIGFAGDGNTGFWSPAGDTVALSTGGSERIRIDSDGDLGVGTSSPTSRLTVRADATSGPNTIIRVENRAASAGATTQNIKIEGIFDYNNGTSDASAGAILFGKEGTYTTATTANDSYLAFETVADNSSTERVRINSAGQLITTSLGTAAAPAVVIGNDVNSGLYSPGADQVAISTGGTGRLFVDASGKVGVGGAPAGGAAFTVQGGGQTILNQGGFSWLEIGNGTTTDQGAYIDLVGDTTYGDYGLRLIRDGGANGASQLVHRGTNDLSIRTQDAAPLTFYTNITERLRITSTGNVGIGTSAPTTGALVIKAGANQLALEAVDSATYGRLDIGHFTNGAFIGTAAGTDPASNLLRFGTSATERMRITSDGKFGIGTSSPSTLLHVAGIARVGANDANEAQLQVGAGATGDRAARVSLVGDTTYTNWGVQLIRGDTGANSASAIEHRGTGNLILNAYDAGTLLFATNNTERARIDSSGRLLVGTSSTSADTRLILQGNSNNVNAGAYLHLQRGTLPAGDGTPTGRLVFADNSSNAGAQLESYSEGAWTSGSSHPGRLVFSTTANGAVSPTERMRITSEGNVGISTSAPAGKLQVSESYASAATKNLLVLKSESAIDNAVMRIAGYAYTGIARSAIDFIQNGGTNFASQLAFSTDPGGGIQERARIDSIGRLLVGTSSARSNFFNTTFSTAQLIEGTSNDNRSLAVVSSAATGAGGVLILASQKSGTVGGNTILAADGEVGLISFQGSDGTDFVEAARIYAHVDGTPGANDMPGRLVFSTTADGASTPTERMRITSAGNVGIGASAPVATLDVTGTFNVSEGAQAKHFGINAAVTPVPVSNGIFAPAGNTLAFTTGALERVRITSIGLVGIGTSTPATTLDVAGGVRFGAANTDDASVEIGAGATGNRNSYIDFVADTTWTDYALRIIRGNTGANADSVIIHKGTGALNFLCEEAGSIGFATANTDRLRITSSGVLQVADAGNISVGTTTGTKIGTATTQKLGFYNATPVVQPAAVANATDAASVITQLNDLLAKLRTLGIIAT